MRIEQFDRLPDDEARALIAPAASVGWWLDELVAARPHGSVDALLALAQTRARAWTANDVAAALAHHPRIGERPSGDGAEAELSRREQAAITDGPGGGGDDVERAIAEGNAAYEARFGRVFLIRAAGRSRPEILAELHRRLALDPDDEEAVVADQLAQIALLRLHGMLS